MEFNLPAASESESMKSSARSGRDLIPTVFLATNLHSSLPKSLFLPCQCTPCDLSLFSYDFCLFFFVCLFSYAVDSIFLLGHMLLFFFFHFCFHFFFSFLPWFLPLPAYTYPFFPIRTLHPHSSEEKHKNIFKRPFQLMLQKALAQHEGLFACTTGPKKY